jgi:hypothetical protein
MKILLCVLMLLCYEKSLCQGSVGAYDSEQFAFQVKQIDEFIERFNNADHTLIKKYLDERYDLEVSRKDLVLSLFDVSELNSTDKQQVASFIDDVVDSKKPPYLSFYDQDWFAKAHCMADYRGNAVTFDIVLAVKVNPEKETVNWEIRSLNMSAMDFHGDFVFNSLLPPSGHGTNFLELRRMFATPASYYDHSQPQENPMNRLLQMAEKGGFVFKGVKGVSYHFLQLDHWIVEVEEYDRKENNSGWLISKLVSADAEVKKSYLQKHLYIN